MVQELATLEAYPGTSAILSKGFELYVEDPADTTFKRVAMVTGMPSASDGEKEQIEVTNLSSAVKEYINGLADPGSVDATFEADMDISDIGQAAVEQAFVNDQANGTETVLPFEIRLPVNDTVGGTRANIAYTASVKEYEITTGPNEQMKISVTLSKKSTSVRSWRTPV